MKLVEHFWTTVTIVVNWFTILPVDVSDGSQSVITPKIDATYTAENIRIQNLYNIDPALEYEISDDGHGPIFKPPTGRPKAVRVLISSANTQVWARTGFLVRPLTIANAG
jgi:hypothetical protein